MLFFVMKKWNLPSITVFDSPKKKKRRSRRRSTTLESKTIKLLLTENLFEIRISIISVVVVVVEIKKLCENSMSIQNFLPFFKAPHFSQKTLFHWRFSFFILIFFLVIFFLAIRESHYVSDELALLNYQLPTTRNNTKPTNKSEDIKSAMREWALSWALVGQ